jgi:anti-sigma regulatory factor (Ser/Thr protein kinase)
MAIDTSEHDGTFRHEALFYAGSDELVERIAGFVREGIDRGEHTLVVLRSSLLDRVRAAADDGAGLVRYADMAEVGRNPARIIPAWRHFVDATAGPLRGVGEPIWSGRSPDELAESERHEALLNLALADAELWLVCPYDLRSLPPAVLDEAGRNHPIVWEAQGRRASARYPGRNDLARPFDRSLPEPAGTVQSMRFDAEGLHDTRRFVDGHARTLGLPPGRTEDLVLAVSEVASNSVRHGGGRGLVQIWRHGASVACEVRDAGRIDLPLVGRQRPVADQTSGFGLWLANQLCDLVQIRSSDEGSAIRLLMSLRDQRSGV